MTNDKLKKTAALFYQIVSICRGVFRALIVVFLVFIALVLIFGEKIFAQGSITMELGFLEILLADHYQAITPMIKLYTVISLLYAIVGAAVLTCICILLREILAPMKEGRPFEKNVPGNLRKIAWITLAGGFINQVLKVLQLRFMVAAWPVEEVFASPAIKGITFQYEMDFQFVLIFGAIMLLSWIFSYGQVLQQESDETV